MVPAPPECQNKDIQARVQALQQQMAGPMSPVTYDRLHREAVKLLKSANMFLTGELPSEPKEVEEFPVWMKKYYPSHVNATCGLHVHMSFKSAYHYQRLMVEDYQDTMVEYLLRWAKTEKFGDKHPIWPRLKGQSEFCQLKFDPDRQSFKTRKEYDHHAPGHRYTAISYAYARYGTVECRLLPMMEEANQGIRAVQCVIDVTNAFLSVQRKREERLIGEVFVQLGDDTLRMESYEHI